jgi:hypothetical protein
MKIHIIENNEAESYLLKKPTRTQMMLHEDIHFKSRYLI